MKIINKVRGSDKHIFNIHFKIFDEIFKSLYNTDIREQKINYL